MNTRRAALRWAVAGLAIHVALVSAALVRTRGNPQWFVHFGEQGSVLPVARQVFGSDLLILHEDGHDGQAFWLLARDPLLLEGRSVLSPYLDRPTYRSQRIAYPALAAPWRLGGEYALLWGLLITNLLAVFAGGYAAALLAADFGAPMRASLAFALNPGVVCATMLDVADGLAVAALLGCLVALRRERFGWAVAAGVLAVTAKEALLLSLLGVAVLAPGLPRRARWLLVGIPAGVGAAWALYVRWRLGWPAGHGVMEFTAPFWGFIVAYRFVWEPLGAWQHAAVALGVLVMAVVTIWRWWARPTLLLTAALPFACLVPFFSVYVLDLALNPFRAVAPLTTLLTIDILRESPARPDAGR